jgi:TonB-dependent SusC/RagA subfamily outer membrane receptor
MKIIFLIAFFQLLLFPSYAQEAVAQDTLVGLVVNAKGKGIRNVPVFALGHEETARTDRKGIFILVDEHLPDSITILLPSKKLYKIPVGGMSFVKIKTSEDTFFVSEDKDEIINIGYGAQRRSNLTSGAFSVTGAELLATGERDIIRAIAGKVPGLNLNYKDNGTVTLQIRGGTSLDNHNEPLYVVDGSVVDDLQYINLNDIEKVDVLKDGSIYGTRGANGAIVVTTKN